MLLAQPSAKQLHAEFYQTNVESLISDYRTKDATYWHEQGFAHSLQLFHTAAQRIPAYKDFLKKNGIHASSVKLYSDFQQLPIIDKSNYLQQYPLKDLCWDGKLDTLSVMSSSSGSTGEPFLWPRGEQQEIEGAIIHEVIFKEVFRVDKYRTLHIDCFSMGTWIAGLFTYSCVDLLAKKGYPIMTITPGLEKELIMTLFKRLAPEFDQIIFSGYPPFIKDIIDSGDQYGINWKDHQIKFLFAAEGFSEKWREYILEKVDAQDALCSSINIYGSADAAALASETPLTTAIRQYASSSQAVLHELFNDSRVPTLAQYDPRLRFFESSNSQLVFTANAGIPLIRYSIGDTGGVMSYDEMNQRMQNNGSSLKELVTNGTKKFDWKLPFVYLFGRTNLTISFYGLLVYPEHIKFGLEHAGLGHSISQKFVMSTEYDTNQDPIFLIKVELARGVKPSNALQRKVQKAVVRGLLTVNTEYKRLQDALKERSLPTIELIEHGDERYFKSGVKQKWVLKA